MENGSKDLRRRKCWNHVLISENYASRAMVGDAKSFSSLTLHFDSGTIVGDNGDFWPEWPYWSHETSISVIASYKLFIIIIVPA